MTQKIFSLLLLWLFQLVSISYSGIRSAKRNVQTIAKHTIFFSLVCEVASSRRMAPASDPKLGKFEERVFLHANQMYSSFVVLLGRNIQK